MTEIPRIVSADDHVVEPPDVFTSRLPAKYRDVGPRVVRAPVAEMTFRGGKYVTRMGRAPGDDGPLADWWLYEDRAVPHTRLGACAGFAPEDVQVVPMTYDEMRPGCYQQAPRLDDMDLNWVEASLCFPTFPRFCGQTFLEADDKDLALLCVQAYNDWMVEEWCAGSGGRLWSRCASIPLWDPVLAAAEVRRNAARGVRAVCFSELPGNLGLPSVHDADRHWDPFVAACDETGTVICMHSGSGSKMPSTSRRRAAGGVVDAHPRARRGLAGRLAVLGAARAPPERDAHLLRGPDRLDPLHPRPGRPGLGAQPGLERLARPRARSRRAPTTGAGSTAASSTTPPASPPSTPSAPTR